MMHPEQLPDQPDTVDDPPFSDVVEQATEPGLVAYKVIGRHRVDEVKKGGLLDLDPAEPRTARLLKRGQIVRVDTTQED